MIQHKTKTKQIVKPKILLKSLDGTSFLKVYKELTLVLGTSTTVYLSCLIDRYNYFENKAMLVEGEYFYTTKNWIERDTALAQTNQTKHSEKLEILGIIKVKFFIMPNSPRRKYYAICDEIITELLTTLNVLKNEYLMKDDKMFLTDVSFKAYKQALKQITINGINPYDIKPTYNTGTDKLVLLKKEVHSEVERSTLDSGVECNTIQGLNVGTFKGCTAIHSGVERQISLSNKTNNKTNNNTKLEENSNEFPGNSFKDNSTGKEKEEVEEVIKFPLDNNKDKEKSEYEEKLYKEYLPVIKEFENFGFSLKFNKDSNTPKYIYNHLHTLAAGEFKSKLKEEQQTKLQDFTKLDNPQPVERLAKYIKKSLTTFQKVKTDPDYWPTDKTKLQKLSVSDFLLSQKKFSWLMYCLADPQPMEKQDHQIQAIKKKFEKLKISDGYIVKNLYNNHNDCHKFTEKEWADLYFSLNSIFNYLVEYEADLSGQGSHETPRTFIDLMATWNLSQSKMVTNFGVGSAPWQWFNDWLKKELGVDMRIKKKRAVQSEKSRIRDREMEALSFFTKTFNEILDKVGKSVAFDDIAEQARKSAIAEFPDVRESVFTIETAE